MIRVSFYLYNNDKFKDSEGYYREKLMVAKNGHINNAVGSMAGRRQASLARLPVIPGGVSFMALL